ncbi:hypothetical protein ACFY4I_08170 [Streptomyces scabiei]|uniref:hypothetical protein n=1 Tax=Streptomyces scabiei TaxID=1930 RepID=UPI0036B1DF34
MRKSRGRLVVGARAVALAVAVGVAASAGTAGMSWASTQSQQAGQSKQADKRSSEYSTADILLGFMGRGAVAKEYPELALVRGKVVGATPEEVDLFLELAAELQPELTDKLRADLTSGNPYRVRFALERLDTLSMVTHQAVADGAVGPGSGSGWFIVGNHAGDPGDGEGLLVVLNKVLAAQEVKIVFSEGFERGKSGLTTDKAVAIVTPVLAGW